MLIANSNIEEQNWAILSKSLIFYINEPSYISCTKMVFSILDLKFYKNYIYSMNRAPHICVVVENLHFFKVSNVISASQSASLFPLRHSFIKCRLHKMLHLVSNYILTIG